MNGPNLLVVEKLKKYFPVGGDLLRKPRAQVRAVEAVDLTLKRGETLGLVGESGCGKTTLGRCILRLIEPTDGNVYFEGDNILTYNHERLRQIRKDMQIVFQDPYSSLNPRKTVGEIVAEGFRIHRIFSRAERQEAVKRMLETVGLLPEHIHRYPHEFSGGQRQRIGVARALLLHPKLIIADEPVSSLDVSVQAQILNLFIKLQQQFSLTYIFISHDLRVVRHISDRVAVMYLGRIVEWAESRDLFTSPLHPYSEALMSSVPATKPTGQKEKILLTGDIPSPIHPPSGCHFHTRCRYSREICKETVPLMENKNGDHWVACHFPKT